MIIKKSVDLVKVVIDEVALEGLDGITLEALWQRLAVTLGETLPLKEAFIEQVWKICLDIDDFTFYELESPREKLIIFDRYEFEYLGSEAEKEFDKRDIYEHCPIEDTKLGIRGSCSTYHTRKDISDSIKHSSLNNPVKYGQKMVIVASQALRERALIEDNVSPTIHLSLAHYCVLERIGRARKIGEITTKKAKNVKEDAKALFYIRKGLHEHGLIRKQVYYQGNTGSIYNGQNMGTLIHLTRFYNVRKPKVIMWAEHLINYLKSKENYAAEYNEVKTELNLEYSIKKFFKIQMLQKVFRTDVKVPYRSYYPHSLDKEWQTKSNASREKVVRLVVLADPNVEISDVWTSEEVKEDIENQLQLDMRNQKLNVPFLKQIYKAVEVQGSKGSSQSELSTQMGFTKLIGRTLVRNLVKAKIVTTYLDDVGRQRTTKFVSREFDEKSSVKKQLAEEISKIKAYGKSMQAEAKIQKKIEEVVPVSETTKGKEKGEKKGEMKTKTNLKQNNCTTVDNKIKDQLLRIANNILYKYKLIKKKNRYCHTSRGKTLQSSKLKSSLAGNTEVGNDIIQERVNQSSGDIIESDFYKTIKTKLVVQNPACKKKSQRAPVVGFMEDVENLDNMQFGLSYRLLRRANLVMESIKKYKIVEDLQSLIKYINAEEEKEGLEIKMDKNSLIRVLQKLSKDNMIKYITLVLKNEDLNKQKEVNFVCDPSVEVNDSVIESAIEKAKLKFCMMEMSSVTENRSTKTSATNSPSKDYIRMKRIMEGRISLPKINSLGKKHGYCPKFIRMKIMHIFLYYLIYDHPQEPVSSENFFEKLRSDGCFTEDLLDCNMNVYNEDIDWRTFIPPLPKHKGYQKGWALMCDLLLRLPLSIFVKINNVNYEVPGMQEYLAHPVKKHFLIKDLPSSIRNLLFIKRRYMFNFHQVVTRLCYIGLVQFGPQQLKEKDRVFIYLNRHTELMDTTSSAAGYHKIEDKPYPVTKFTFTSMPVVENYWYEMWNTCINTCLGGRIVVEGKDILLEELSRKSEMVEAQIARQIHEAEKYDTGSVPGDRKGAAGIDSAFFAHLKRNWNWINTSTQSAQKVYKPPKPSKPSKPQKMEIPNSLPRKTVQPKKLGSPAKKGVSAKPRQMLKSSAKAKAQATLNFPIITANKQTKVIRKVLPRKKMSRRRVKYDEIDFSALQRMDKLRVDWEQHEDNILLVCKVAMVYLCPNPRRNPVTFTAIRDILRSFSFTSYNKTSRACQRRLLYMLKQQKTWNSVLLGVEEIKQDYYVTKRFGGLLEKLRNERENQIEFEKKVEKVFKDLVSYIAKKYYNISNSDHREPVPIPKTIQEFNIFYKLKLPTKTIMTPGVSTEVRAVSDIHTATINSVIHSSMCCGKERRSWAYQLFKVYQQYSEALLRNAMLKIRADQMVTMKKSYMCAYKKFGNCMPMSSSQYQLSSAYYYKFQTKWPYEVFSESYNILFSLLENYVEKINGATDGLEVKPAIGGTVVALNDLVTTQKVDIDIEIPDQIIMLDPGLPEKDDVYQRIALRFQTILENLSHDVSLQRMEYADSVCDNSATDTGSSRAIIQQTNSAEIYSINRITDQTEENNSKGGKIPSDDQQHHFAQPYTTDEYTNLVASKSVKRPCEYNSDQLEAKKQKLSTQENEPESHQSNVDLELLTANQTNNENVDEPSEPMVVDCCKEAIAAPTDENTKSEKRLSEEKRSNLESNEVTVCENKTSCTRVSELVKRMVYPEIIEDIAGRVDIQDVRTRQTRIAMLRMREELHDLNLQDSHHAHEYFVVNSFKLLGSLIAKEEDEKSLVSYQSLELPKSLLPIDIELVNKVLEGIKSFAIFPKTSMSHDDLKKVIQESALDWNDVSNVCRFIKSKAAFGATLQELAKTFRHFGNKLADILALLTEKRMILRAGIVTVRYVYHRYVNPWIIESYKILRLEKESHQTVPEGSVYILDNEEAVDKEKEAKRVTTAANLFYSSPDEPNSEISQRKETTDKDKSSEDSKKNLTQVLDHEESKNKESGTDNVPPKTNENPQAEGNNIENDEEGQTGQKKLRRNRTVLLKQKDVYRAAKLLDFNTAEEIRVVVKPWIRIDGVLNRRVLDRMLGAVLCFCIEKPGASLTLIQNRFTPALQPYHTRELIEILTKLSCVHMTAQVMGRITLFSKPAKLDLTGNPDLVAESDLIVVHPSIQASLKFGTFLSNRSYNLDFLSTQ